MPIMRITTSQIFQRGLSNLLVQQAKTLKLQQQLSSQKKIQYPSDDPLVAIQGDLLRQTINFTNSYQQNRQAAEAAISFEESILSNSIAVLQKIRELQVQAGNNSLSLPDRQAIAAEAQSLLNQLQDLGNSQDSDGHYIFSGSQTTTQPFTINASGQYVYNGDETQRFQVISSGMQVALNDNGSGIFMAIPNGNGFFTVAQTATPNTGNSYASTGSVVDATAYVPDNYTIQFVLNSSNQLVVMVSGAASGPVLPPDGNPNDAPLYQDGGAIDFNGIELVISGTPQPGDAYAINPAQNQSIFTTIAQMVANLGNPFVTAADKAATQTINNQIMEEIDAALTNILTFEGQLGARLNQVDLADQINSDIIGVSQETLIAVEDVNLAEVAVQLNLEEVYLQAAQQSFARIQGLTMFNYI